MCLHWKDSVLKSANKTECPLMFTTTRQPRYRDCFQKHENVVAKFLKYLHFVRVLLEKHNVCVLSLQCEPAIRLYYYVVLTNM